MLGKLAGASNDGLPEAEREGWGRSRWRFPTNSYIINSLQSASP